MMLNLMQLCIEASQLPDFIIKAKFSKLQQIVSAPVLVNPPPQCVALCAPELKVLLKPQL